MKIGIFGGSFNPPHMGHVQAVTTVANKMGLDRVYIIPTFKSPLKKLEIEGPTPEQRVEMAHAAFSGYGSRFIVDDREVRRGGTSYTIDTLKEIKKNHPQDELFLVFGADKFDEFSEWKEPKSILEIANLIVTSRPGFELPSEKEELPLFFQKITTDFDFNILELSTGHRVEFISIEDIEASSSELRKKFRVGRPVGKFVPLSVETYIRDNSLYKSLGSKISNYEDLLKFSAKVLSDKKGIQIRGYDLRKITAPCDFSLVCSGTSTRHAVSLAENLVIAVKEEYSVHPLSVEGNDEGRWVVIDYGNFIVHVFYDFVRQEYSIENLWSQGKEILLQDSK